MLFVGSLASAQTPTRDVIYMKTGGTAFTNRVGVTGISTGGHLALMIAGSSQSPVSAVAAIAPPTDLANWGKPAFAFTDDPQLAMFVPALGLDSNAAKNAAVALAKQLSPIGLVNAEFPPTLIIHGDSDKVVPLQYSASR